MMKVKLSRSIDIIAKEISKEINTHGEKVQKAIFAAANDEIFNQSQKLVPVDNGDLQASGHIVVEKRDPYTIKIWYDAEYAVYVHEMSSDSNWTKAGTNSKYLEKFIRPFERKMVYLVKKYMELI